MWTWPLLKTAIFATTVALTAGCAELNSIQWSFDDQLSKTGQARIHTIDAKQRVVTSKAFKGAPYVCAEKSPDVFSVLSSSGSLSIDTVKVGGSLAAALAESGADIGLRTQLTQLQAEFLYRLCENYSNGAIDDIQLETQLRRFQHITLAALAVEQLTAPYRPKVSQALYTNAAARVGEDTTRAEENLKTVNGDLVKKKGELETQQKQFKEKKCDAEKKDEQDCKDLAAKIEAKLGEIKGAEQAVVDRERELRIARTALQATAGAAPSSIVNVYGPTEAPKVDKDVAKEIRAIVLGTINQTYLSDTCSQALIRQPKPKIPNQTIDNTAPIPGESDFKWTQFCKLVLDAQRTAWLTRNLGGANSKQACLLAAVDKFTATADKLTDSERAAGSAVWANTLCANVTMDENEIDIPPLRPLNLDEPQLMLQ